TSSLATAAIAAYPKLADAQPVVKTDWDSIRSQFDLNPNFTHLGLFYIASNPRPVRDAVAEYRRRLDSNPFITVERAMFEKPEENIPLKVCNTIASYIGANPNDIALTSCTTMGL